MHVPNRHKTHALSFVTQKTLLAGHDPIRMDGRNYPLGQAEGVSMQPHEIASIATSIRIAFTSDRSPVPTELHATDTIVFPASVEKLQTIGDRAGPDLWIIEDDHALEVAWRARGWTSVVAIIGRSSRWMSDADGRFVLVPELDAENTHRLRKLAQDDLATTAQKTPYETCSLRERDRMLRSALRKTKVQKGEPCVSTAASILGISRQLCQKHIRELAEVWNTPVKAVVREPTSGVVSRVAPRILIVDDDERITRSVQRSLRCAGKVTSVADPEDAERVLEEQHWDVVLLDIHLGRANGLEILARVRKHGCKSRVIVLTGDHSKNLRDFAETLGVEAFLGKGAHDDIDMATADNLVYRVGSALLRA